MKIVDACPNDTEVRRAGLALVVGIAEHGDGSSDVVNAEGADDDSFSFTSGTGSHQSCTDVAAVVNRLGIVGAVAFVAAWLREATAPAWAWNGISYGNGGGEERVRDLLLSCKAAFLLCQYSSVNRDRLASMGAIEALSRAIALSGRSNGLEDSAGNPIAAEQRMHPSEQDQVASVQAETQVWAAQAVAELAGGRANKDRCAALMRAGALRALFAAMSRCPSARRLQRAGCITLASVAACLNPKDLQMLGRNGGAQAVIFALGACPGDKNVAWAGLLAVAKLSTSSDNRRLLGQAGACPLIAKVLLECSDNYVIAEEGCKAVAGLAALSGFNRTTLGHAGAAEATAAALRKHPSKPTTQRWGLCAAAALVADTDPSGNTSRITNAGILDSAAQALKRFRHNPTVQTEGLRALAKVATAGDEGVEAAWAVGIVLPTVQALGQYLNDGDIQLWGMVTIRALTGSEDKCDQWRAAGAPEAVVRTMRSFCKGGSGRRSRHDDVEQGRLSEARNCTADESLCIQFQACAAALRLASSPDGCRRLVRERAGEALAGMMTNNPLHLVAQRGALATLAALSASGAENRKRLHRYRKPELSVLPDALSTI